MVEVANGVTMSVGSGGAYNRENAIVSVEEISMWAVKDLDKGIVAGSLRFWKSLGRPTT